MFDMITTTWFPLSIHSLQGLPSPIKDPPSVSPSFPRKGWIAWGGVGREARTALITSDISNTDHRNAPLMPQNYHLFVIIDSILLLLSGALYGQYDTMRDLKPNATVSQQSILDTKLTGPLKKVMQFMQKLSYTHFPIPPCLNVVLLQSTRVNIYGWRPDSAKKISWHGCCN